MPAPNLKNPDWNARLQKVAPRLDGFQARLNQISEDIRALEKYLTDSGFRIETTCQWFAGDGIAWMEIKGNWRLCYVVDQGDQREVRVLIETPAATRLAASDHIEEFLDELDKVSRTGTGFKGEEPTSVEPPTDDDIPF